MIVLGYEAHEVRYLSDDDAVRSSQAAGGCQVAAGVAGLQGCGCSGCAGADRTAASQIGRVDVDKPCGARWRCSEDMLNSFVLTVNKNMHSFSEG